MTGFVPQRKRTALAVPILLGACLLAAAALSTAAAQGRPAGLDIWNEAERAFLRSLWIGNLPPPPPDPSNRYADHPGAARLGKKIFFDTRFSANGSVACGTCHLPEYDFTDRFPRGRGLAEARRRTMPLIGMAYQDWFFWDGRKDSLWSQALAPLEDPKEHGISRTRCAILLDEHYREEYQAVFGDLPLFSRQSLPGGARPGAEDRSWRTLSLEQRQAINRAFANLGKAVAAYVRSVLPSPARFDRYVAALDAGDEAGLEILDPEEVAGLRLFVGKAKCVNCHLGPLFTNADFHVTGVAQGPDADRGRAEGIPLVREDSFSCLGEYSDADPATDCLHVRFMDDAPSRYEKAFKTPTLRNVTSHPPYTHAGRFGTTLEVLEFYREAARSGMADDLEHADLTDEELRQLNAFLDALTSPLREELPPR